MSHKVGDSTNPPLVSADHTNYGAVPVVTIDAADEHVSMLEASAPSLPQFQDMFFGVLFWIHAAAMLWLGLSVAPRGYESMNFDLTSIDEEIRKGDNDMKEEDWQQFKDFVNQATEYMELYPIRILYYLVIPCCCGAFVIALGTTFFILQPFPRTVVYGCLIGSFMTSALLLLISIITSHSVALSFMMFIMMIAVIYYVRLAWRMVPFAAVNLKIALQGMSQNWGIYVVACIITQLGLFWLVFWCYTVVGFTSYETEKCQAAHPGADFDDITADDYDDSCEPSSLAFMLFLLSLYWTSTVVMNTIQVTVAGVMATWCFDKDEASSCCSCAVFGSLFRSLTYAFGSICFGSLLQAIVSVFRWLVESARNQRDNAENSFCGSIFLCVLECLARLFEDILSYFNQWAYVFVGIYGFSYLESGRKVLELFHARGWTTIITDNLVGYVLNATTVFVSILSGFLAVCVEQFVSSRFHDADHSDDLGPSYLGLNKFSAFGIGAVIGLWVSSVIMNVIEGAVNTLIVCWADSPAVVETQHPSLTREMVESWTSVFPESSTQIRPAYGIVV